MKRIEKFARMRSKAMSGKEDYLFIGCTQKAAAAVMSGSEEVRIKNALFVVQSKGELMVWSVKEGHIEQCPKTLALTAKHLETLVGVIGDPKNEQDYFTFGYSEETDSKIDFLFGVAEISSCCTVFLFDWNSKNVYSSEESIWSNQNSHLFVLLEAARNLGRRIQTDERRDLQSEETYSYESSWEEDM